MAAASMRRATNHRTPTAARLRDDCIAARIKTGVQTAQTDRANRRCHGSTFLVALGNATHHTTTAAALQNTYPLLQRCILRLERIYLELQTMQLPFQLVVKVVHFFHLFLQFIKLTSAQLRKYSRFDHYSALSCGLFQCYIQSSPFFRVAPRLLTHHCTCH